MAFDILQVQVKALDQLLHNMADIDDMADELDDAAKKAGITQFRRTSGLNTNPTFLRALEDHPGRWRLTTLLAFVSSGVMWSEETKRGLLHHHPGLMLIDAFSSSEAIGMGT